MDGETAIDAEVFFGMLKRTLPNRTALPWDDLPWRPLVDLALFVHRVRGVEPGLYLMLRDPARRTTLRGEIREEFEWVRPTGCPEDLPLYRLLESPVRDAATTIGCHQDIAGDGAFSLGMIAAFEPVLRGSGAPWYRHLHWEAGTIGQVLYLEAEAAGVRSTGMGCFFDDAMHQALGLPNRRFQTLYHFTVGGAVEDDRLTTLPAYG
jgi:nitroreductase